MFTPMESSTRRLEKIDKPGPAISPRADELILKELPQDLRRQEFLLDWFLRLFSHSQTHSLGNPELWGALRKVTLALASIQSRWLWFRSAVL